MKYIYAIMLALLLTACSASGDKQTEEKSDEVDHSAHMAEGKEQPKSKSPASQAMSIIGENHVHIEYHSPSKRDRQIFGGLVAYGEVWVTGAHNATSIRFSKDVEIGGIEIPEGKYALFTIPREDEWTVIINKNWDQHLVDEYNEAEDIVRLKVTPEKLEEPVESLTYEVIAEDAKTGTIVISWDDVSVSFTVKNA
ncbi:MULTISPECIES: DUF2911 domain-containing protein [Roseivirga]|nr:MULTISPECIES: DUF2911 domain-containing protein [Roseivirga]MBO6496563.1 DUF2911 domain-containing protein [Roseivirga sp.]MBO6662655.1 DUF2911 domain-containing protein [Roseivirga sp.]MBO6762672.1 DUF2911 domain-containing protein [Roseivirga sp.]MBO6909662.1 DUF2911 domain-containing protein [Roseivirga sp.]WPZ10957.1 DUF2911 domain-containing protein [Roseivirga spongicola]